MDNVFCFSYSINKTSFTDRFSDWKHLSNEYKATILQYITNSLPNNS